MIQIPRKNKIFKKITDRYLEITPRDISKIYNEKFNFQYFFFFLHESDTSATKGG